MNDTMDKRIEDLSIDNKEKLTKDSIAAIICLEDEMIDIIAAVALIKSGEIVAEYKGDRSTPYDSNKFILMSEREFEEEKNNKHKK